MKRSTYFIFWVIVRIGVAACNTTKYIIGKAYRSMSGTQKEMADSILLNALDNEAIYTLLDTLKPMSSVQYFEMPLLSEDAKEVDSTTSELIKIQNVINKMSMGDWQFILNPFARVDSIYRGIEIYVFRKSKLNSLIKQHQQYFIQWGFTPNTNPATILAITEYEDEYDRWRNYGYLFGYPDYAVDFFVNAGKNEDSTKVFVKRDFFSIPVYTDSTGHFTYAVPKGYQTNAIDSLLYKKAIITLNKYKRLREKYTKNGSTKTFKIFQKLN